MSTALEPKAEILECAELTLRTGIQIRERLVAAPVSKAGIVGLRGPAKIKRLHGLITIDDLVHRKFYWLSPSELWVTGVTDTLTA